MVGAEPVASAAPVEIEIDPVLVDAQQFGALDRFVAGQARHDPSVSVRAHPVSLPADRGRDRLCRRPTSCYRWPMRYAADNARLVAPLRAATHSRTHSRGRPDRAAVFVSHVGWPPGRPHPTKESPMPATIRAAATATAAVDRPRRLSGFKPTGRLQLGNYLGAIRPMLDAQHGRTRS